MGELGVEDETFCNSIRSFHLTGLLPAALHDRKVEPVILTGKFSQQSHGNEEVELDPSVTPRTQKETSFHQDPRTYPPKKTRSPPSQTASTQVPPSRPQQVKKCFPSSVWQICESLRVSMEIPTSAAPSQATYIIPPPLPTDDEAAFRPALPVKARAVFPMSLSGHQSL